MRSIHRFDQISGSVFVALLIVTQILSPLIHGHGGYEEPVRGFHLPGFENLSNISERMDIGSNSGFQYAGLELIISVASGIEAEYPDDLNFDDKEPFTPVPSVYKDIDLDTPAAKFNIPISHQLTFRSWALQPTRAPPQF